MTTKLLLAPQLRLDQITPALQSLNGLMASLAGLQDACPGDLVGIAAGHFPPRPKLRRPISEYMCAFVATASGCDAAASLFTPSAGEKVDHISRSLAVSLIAKQLHAELGCPCPQIETVHFKEFAFVLDLPIGVAKTSSGKIVLRIYTESLHSIADAERRAADICEALRVLEEVHAGLGAVRFARPTADMLMCADRAMAEDG